MQLERGATMGRVGTMERAEDAEIIDALGDVGEEFADGQSALPILFEAPRGLEQLAGLGKLDARLGEGIGLAIIALEQRLGVEGIDMARSAFHEQEDDAFGLGGKVRGLRGEWIEER